MSSQLATIGVLTAMGLLWLFVNIKAALSWLKWFSFVAMCVFMIAASAMAVVYVLGVLA